MNTTRRALLGAAALGLAAPRLALAASWPERPITLVVPFGAGGGNDVTARTLGQFLEKELGQGIVVVNRPGAGGEIGINAVADSRPDGYTFGILNTPGLATIPIERKPRWNMDSFIFVAGLVDDPGVIAVHPDSPIKTAKDLVAAAKKDPGAINIAVQGLGSTSFLSVRMLEMVADIKVEGVIYPSLPQGVLALAQKEVQGAAANLGEGMVMSAGQPWHVIGVMSDARSPIAPELPTFKEQGFDVSIGSLRGLVGPKGLPKEVTDRMGAALAKIWADPEYIALCQRTQQPLRPMKQAEYEAYMASADARFRAMWDKQPWLQQN